MKRTFFTNLLLLLILNLLIKPFWVFGIDRTVQNVVGAESYGMYFALFNFSMVLNMFLDLGITNFNSRSIARHSQLLAKYLSYLVSLKVLLAVGYAVIVLLAAVLIGYRGRQLHLLYFLVANQFLVSFTFYLRSNISALHFFRTDSLLSVLDRSLMIGLCSALLFTGWWGGRFSIGWFVYAQSLAYLLTAMVTFGLVWHYSGGFRLRVKLKIYSSFLRQSLPFALLVLLMSVYTRLDTVLIERLLPLNGQQQAGIYAQAFRLFDAAAMLGLLFAGLLLPIFSRMLKRKEDVSPMVAFSTELIMVPALLVAVVAGFYAQHLMQLLYHQHLQESAELLTPLMIGFTGVAAGSVFGTLLTANGNLRSLNLMAFVFMLLNIGLNGWLIPRIGALGAARVAMVTQLGIALTQILLAGRYFHFKINYLLLLRLTGYLLFLLVAGKISRFFGNWHLGLFVLVAAGLVYAAGVKLINIPALAELLKGEER